MKNNESLIATIMSDFIVNMNGKSDLSSKLSCIFFNRGFHLLLLHRMQVSLRRLPYVGKFLSKILWYIASCLYACEISDIAKLAGGIFIPHPSGIVIGDGVVIEKNVCILQHVTVGTRRHNDKNYPFIRESAYLGAGAKILGGVTVGEGAIVGANSVVLKDVGSGTIVAGIPAQRIKK